MFSKKLLLAQIEHQFNKTLTIYNNSVQYKDPYINRAKDNLSINADDLNGADNTSIAHDYVDTRHEDIFFKKQVDYK